MSFDNQGFGSGSSDDGWGFGPESTKFDSWPTAEGDGAEWGSSMTFSEFRIPEPASVLPLLGGTVAALVGIAVYFVADREDIGLSAIGWLFSAVISVICVGVYQSNDLKGASSSMVYTSNESANFLRFLPLGLGVIGIVLNSIHIASWVATR